MAGVLEGTRVLDFGRYIAGPFCATMLADLGAEVIRIERIEGSEDRFVSSVAKGGEGGTLLQMGRNKLGFTLDPMKPRGKEVLARLVKTADVVVANLPGATLKAMGIDYASLKAIKPDIVLTVCTAFGTDGPYAERVGFDLMGQAMSGAMYLTGEGETPTRTNTPYVDYGTALFACVGTLVALMERRKTGEGQMVEASLLSTATAFNNNFLIEEGVLAPGRTRRGNRGFHHAPNDAYRTKDGWLVTMVVGRPLFERWARLMGEPHWLTDPRFDSDLDRGEHSDVISERMARWCGERTTGQAIAELEQARIPAGPVLSPAQVLADPHVRARQLLKPIEYPGLPRPAPVADTPVRLSRSSWGIRRRAPLLAEHTEAILAELGYSPAEIAELRKAKVV
ncbi:MAG: CoA transferase [Candidatus Lambdaproteobacteria bacterium]|nr:CoA transferase [Candidatus Lambdaproteobacteria bacterium]